MSVQKATAPEKSLLERPPLEYKPGDTERLRQVSATFTLAGTAEPKREEQPRRKRRPSSRGRRTSAKTAASAARYTARFVVLLLLAAGFGAVHALTPGHGKTLVAAYLVGERGTVWHALILGLMTTLTHTGAVFVLAFVFLISPDTADLIYYVQGLIGGLFIAGLGLWLLIRRLAGRADHFHLGGHSHHHHHDHHHDHDHSHADHVHDPIVSAGTSVRWWHLMLLGMRGGLVPCWDAIILLGLAISAQRVMAGRTAVAGLQRRIGGRACRSWRRCGLGAELGRRAGETDQRLGKAIRVLPLLSAASSPCSACGCATTASIPKAAGRDTARA